MPKKVRAALLTSSRALPPPSPASGRGSAMEEQLAAPAPAAPSAPKRKAAPGALPAASSAPKRKATTGAPAAPSPPARKAAQRRLGLPPPLETAGSSTPATGGEAGVVRVKATGKRPPRDPSSAAAARARDALPPPSLPPPSSTSPSPSAPFVAPATSMPEAQEVLGEMPASVDDESFLNMMNEQSFGNTDFVDTFDTNTIDDDEIGSDVDGELPKKRGSRGVNFTIAEDETLVRAWQAISLDPITGDEQPSATYWKRIWDHFGRNNNSGIYRSEISLKHRWQTIQVSFTKWADALEQVDRLNPSGQTARDKVNTAQRLYKGRPKKRGANAGKVGKAFTLQHCWVLLEHAEKWRTRNNEVPTKSKKSSNSEDGFVDVDDSDGSDSSAKRSPTPSSAPPKRPPGRKQEKDKLKKGGESAYKESLDNMMKTRKELAAEGKEFKSARWLELKEMEERRAEMEERRAVAEERRAAAEERRAAVEERRMAAEEAAKRLEQEQRIMFMDSTNLDAKGRAYLELMRDQVLASRSMGGFGGNWGFGGNGSSSDIGGSGNGGDSDEPN